MKIDWSKPIRPKKRLPKSAIDPELKAQIEQEQREQAKFRQWHKNPINRGEIEDLSVQWRSRAQANKTALINLVISAHAFVDGITRANEALKYGLNMGDTIAINDATKLIDKIFKIEIAGLYTSLASCPQAQKKHIMQRIIAQEFPLKDNMVKEKSGHDVSNQLREYLATKVK